MTIDATVRLAAAAISLAVVSGGCGGGGGGGSTVASSATRAALAGADRAPSFAYTRDEYGMENPTYLSATSSALGLVLRTAVASSLSDPGYRTVSRIDIDDPGSISAGVVYSLGTGSGGPSFPGHLFFFNGHDSTLLETVGGAITFTSFGGNSGDQISGRYSAVVLDGYDTGRPQGTYAIAADFAFTADGFGLLLPVSEPVPAEGFTSYATKCARCHSLGSLDGDGDGAPDLSLKGGKLQPGFPAGSAEHDGIVLSITEVRALKALFNAN